MFKEGKESETVCAATLIVMNVLLLVAAGQTVWLVYSVISNMGFLKALARGGFLI